MNGAESPLVLLPLDRLQAHPLNPNVVSPDVRQKLLRHIADSRRYPPLVVRPLGDGNHQIIDGHVRAGVLSELGATTAQCVIWDVSDEQALLLVATINTLHGKDAPARRGALLSALSAERSLAELARLLPESEAQLEAVLRLPDLDVEALVAGFSREIERAAAEQPRLFSFAVPPENVAEVQAALDHATSTLTGANRSGRALALIARGYREWLLHGRVR